ncbi:MAG: metallopeptidase TldD-related protein [Bacillota bacterium]
MTPLMDFFTDRLEAKRRSAASGLRGWRIALVESTALEAGIKDNMMGGPYMSPSRKEELTGEVNLLWGGSRFTLANITRDTADDFEKQWALWAKTAYHDPEGPELLPPQAYPDVPVFDERISGSLHGNPGSLVDFLKKAQESALVYGAGKIDRGFINGVEQQKYIRNSEGLDYQGRATSFSCMLSADARYGDALRQRFWPGEKERDRFCRRIGETAALLKKDAPARKPAVIVFTPQLVEDFLDHYFLSNLNGSLVANRRAAFSWPDFQGNKKVWRGDLSFHIDNTVPGNIGSYHCTSEGAPGGKMDLIRNGCLRQPFLNVKYGQKLGLPPTPQPSNGSGFFLDAERKEDYRAMLAGFDQAVLVFSVLGLHTQDYTSGKFSLTADQCLGLERGEITGRVKMVITGNIFEIFNRDDTRFAVVEGEDNPALAFVNR